MDTHATASTLSRNSLDSLSRVRFALFNSLYNPIFLWLSAVADSHPTMVMVTENSREFHINVSIYSGFLYMLAN